MAHIYHIPSWWPSQRNQFNGIFIFELIRNIAIQDARYHHTVAVFNTSFRWVSMTNFFRDFLGFLKKDTPIRFSGDMNVDVIEIPRVIGINPKTGINYIEQLVHRYQYHINSLSYKPDLIHVHVSFPSMVIGYELSRQLNIPFILTEHATRFPDDRFAQYGYDQLYLENAFSASQTNFSVSNVLANLFSFYGPATSQVIYNAVRWDRPVLQTTLKRREGLFSFVWIGMMNTTRKRVDILLKAIQQLSKMRPGFNCTLIGSGSLLESYKQLCSQLAIDPFITWLEPGTSEVIQSTLAQSDCLVISSDYETFGITAIEAFSYGLPVISTACGGVEEIMQDHCGRVVNKNDVQALAMTMAWIIDHIELFDPSAIQDYCYNNFDKSSIAKKYLNAYHNFLNKASA